MRQVIGGHRTTLVGRVAPTTDDFPVVFNDNRLIHASLRARRRDWPRWEFSDYDAYRAYMRSAAGQDMFGGVQYPISLRPDGVFRVEDVPPGEYAFSALANLPRHDGGTIIGGIAEQIIVIGPYPGGQDRVIDVGAVPLHMRRRWDVGKVLPDFETTTHTGKPLRLSDYRGRHTVLAFWSAWYTDGEVASLKALRELERVWGRDDRVGLLGLDMGRDAENAKAVIAKLGVESPQGWAEQEGSRGIRYDFGVDGSQILYLVSPEGRLLAKSSEAAVIQKELERSLAAAR